MGWLRLVGSLKSYASFAKEPYKRDYILQKRPIISRTLLIVATPDVARSLLKKRPSFARVFCKRDIDICKRDIDLCNRALHMRNT